jgi:hypothetical protein
MATTTNTPDSDGAATATRLLDMKAVVATLPRWDQTDVVRHMVRDMSATEKARFAQQLGFPPPHGNVANQIWLLVIGCFVFVLGGSFLTMAVAIFMKVPAELLLTVFTTTVGFLAGLLTQSPVAHKGSGGTVTTEVD